MGANQSSENDQKIGFGIGQLIVVFFASCFRLDRYSVLLLSIYAICIEETEDLRWSIRSHYCHKRTLSVD